mmetsp:Transcript_44326/g.105587  ORF Transcript_44326/g.105587 Transcript_44326/m.105587 type:complete len:213 (+) Transcript_44326:504-1142(+)
MSGARRQRGCQESSTAAAAPTSETACPTSEATLGPRRRGRRQATAATSSRPTTLATAPWRASPALQRGGSRISRRWPRRWFRLAAWFLFRVSLPGCGSGSCGSRPTSRSRSATSQSAAKAPHRPRWVRAETATTCSRRARPSSVSKADSALLPRALRRPRDCLLGPAGSAGREQTPRPPPAGAFAARVSALSRRLIWPHRFGERLGSRPLRR